MPRFIITRYSTPRIVSYIILLIFIEWSMFLLFINVSENTSIQKSELYNYGVSNTSYQTKTRNRTAIKQPTGERLLDSQKVEIDLDNVKNCTVKEVKLSNTPLPVIGLVGFPGSGSTWARHLIQQMTGLGTSSMYCDAALKINGFPFECNKQVRKTVVVKTHEEKHFVYFKKIVLLLRNPYEALLAYFAWTKAGHTGHPSSKDLQEACNRTFDWSVWWYMDLINASLTRYNGPVHVLQYEKLKTDMSHELSKLAKFLEVNVTEHDISCTIKLQEGQFHRKTNETERLKLLHSIYDKNKLNRLQTATRKTKQLFQDRLNLTIDVEDIVEKMLLVNS